MFPGLSRTATNFSWSLRRYRHTATKLVSRWSQTFQENGIPEPFWSARHIIDHVSKRPSETTGTLPSKPLSYSQVEEISRLCQKRLQRVPVQYIIGEWDFRYNSLILRPPVFIPEPETEELVGLVIQHSVQKANFGDASSRVFLDAGCGSGAISIALLTECPQLVGYAIDVSTKAVDLTKENACRNNVTDRLTVHHCSIQQGLDTLPSNYFQYIISNPPYISTATIDTLQQEVKDCGEVLIQPAKTQDDSYHDNCPQHKRQGEIEWEAGFPNNHRAVIVMKTAYYIDRRALDGGQDGMATTRQLIAVSQQLLTPGGELWIETDLGQDIARLCEGTLLSYAAAYPDYTGRNRFHHLKKTKTSTK